MALLQNVQLNKVGYNTGMQKQENDYNPSSAAFSNSAGHQQY